MTSPRWARDVEDRYGHKTRWYAHPTKHNGEPVWRSVTHTIAALPKEGIPRWAARTVAEYAFDHPDQWRHLPREDWEEQVETAAGRQKKVRHKGAVSTLKGVPWLVRDQAAARGSEVHDVVEKMINGQDYTVEAEVYPWVAAAQEYVARCRPRPRLTEVSIYNDTHLYAGSADFLGSLEALPELGTDVLVDYKTGKDVYDDMAVQLVAYAKGEYYLDAADRERPWPQASAAVIVHLGPAGFKVYRSPLKKMLWEVFLAAKTIRAWQTDGPGLEELAAPEPEPSWGEIWRRQKETELASRWQSLDLGQRTALVGLLAEAGIPERVEVMSDLELEEAVGLALAVDADEVAPSRSGRPAQRPMP
jgi:hypothetical protein